MSPAPVDIAMDKLQAQALIEKKAGNAQSLYCQAGAVRYLERTRPLIDKGYLRQDVIGGGARGKVVVFVV